MDSAVALWNELLPERYRIDTSLFQFNTFESGLLVPEACTFSDDGFLVVKSGRFGSEGAAHISAMAFRDDEKWKEALSRARAVLSSMGFNRWQFGGDWRHFFPGCPVDCTRLASTLEGGEFVRQGTPVFDVERDLRDYLAPVEPTGGVRACLVSDKDELESFLAREFPGRWHTDVMEKFGENSARVYVLVLSGAIEGFAMTQMEGDVNRRAGAVWSGSLGPNWAALGPIGVSKSVRGQGHGHGLLAAALCSLRDHGARRTIIDWTTLTGFYGRHGFVVERDYETFVGPL